MEKYKYLHIALQGEIENGGFFTELSNVLASREINLRPSEHVFITSKGSTFLQTHNPHIKVIASDKNQIQVINKYGKMAEFIFIHGFCSKIPGILRINPCLDQKIIWRTWGHDIRIPTPHKNPLHTCYRYLSFWLFKQKVKRFLAVGISNLTDKIKVEKAFGKNISTIKMNYGIQRFGETSYAELLYRAALKSSRNDNQIKIMVGHSGNSTDDHINMLQKLTKYRDENILVSLPLSYGDITYINAVKEFAEKNFPGKCEFIVKSLPYYEYATYINSVDIAIMNMKNSAALGNILLLIYYKKKLFINAEGDLRAAFDYVEGEYSSTDEIDCMSFDEFSRPLKNPEKLKKAWCECFNDLHFYEHSWEKVLLYLDSIEK